MQFKAWLRELMDNQVLAWGYAFIQPSSSQKSLGVGLKVDPHSSLSFTAAPTCLQY